MRSEVPIREMPGRSKPWLVDLRYCGGGRKFYDTRDAAERARADKLKEITNIGRAAMALTDAEKVAVAQAKAELAKRGATIEQAFQFFIRHHAALRSVQMPAAVEEFLAAKAGNKLRDPEYLRVLRSNLTRFSASVRTKQVHEVTQDDVDRWLANPEWSPLTIRNKQIDLGTFFSFAKKKSWIVADPTEHRESIGAGDAVIGILKPDEAEALLKAAAASYRKFLPYVVLGLFCGLRSDEAVQLEQRHIQAERGFVEVPAWSDEARREGVSKSRQRRIVDLSENARAWLAICEPIKPKSESWHSNRLQVVRPRAAKILGRKFHWPKNCLRHSFASYHLALHGDAGKTATQMGHRSTEMLFRHYRELVTREDAGRFWGIRP